MNPERNQANDPFKNIFNILKSKYDDDDNFTLKKITPLERKEFDGFSSSYLLKLHV